MYKGLIFTFAFLLIGRLGLEAQVKRFNPIPLAAPFLNISPDARAAALGETGVATTPDLNSSYWNSAKNAFYDFESRAFSDAISFSITPLLGDFSTKINNYYLSYLHQIDAKASFSAQLMYFNLGKLTFTDVNGNTTGEYNPNEFSLGIGYSRKFNDYFSLGMNLKYIRSELTATGASFVSNSNGAGNALAADVGFYYQQNIDDRQMISSGIALSNIGSKMISENISNDGDFLPMNLRIGMAYQFEIDDLDRLKFSLDLNKLLVPTPPIYKTNEDDAQRRHIERGKNPNVSVVQGLVQSFYDAPYGLKEELSEIQFGLGLEWSIANQFAIRLGTIYQNRQKGFHRLVTAGIGYIYKKFEVDIAYQYAYDQYLKTARNNSIRVGIGLAF